MTARTRSQPVTARGAGRLRRQLFVERVAFLGIIAILAVVAVRQARALRAYEITVNGRPVVSIGDAATANRLLRDLRGNTGDARFRQMVAVRRADLRAWLMPESRAREILAERITVVVPGPVILVRGRVAATLASREQAQQVLSRLRQASGGSQAQWRLAQLARVEETEVARARIVSADQAFRALTSAESGRSGRS